MEGTTENITAFLESGADIDAQNTTGSTALHTAVRFSEPKVVSQLLDAKANVNIHDDEFHTPLYTANKRGDPDIIALLTAASQ